MLNLTDHIVHGFLSLIFRLNESSLCKLAFCAELSITCKMLLRGEEKVVPLRYNTYMKPDTFVSCVLDCDGKWLYTSYA